jgi:hypothetical protein
MPKWYGRSDRDCECSITAGSNQPTVTLRITFASPTGETRGKWAFVLHITSQCLEKMLSHLHAFCSSDWLISLKLVPNLHVSFHIALTELIPSSWSWREYFPSKGRNGWREQKLLRIKFVVTFILHNVSSWQSSLFSRKLWHHPPKLLSNSVSILHNEILSRWVPFRSVQLYNKETLGLSQRRIEGRKVCPRSQNAFQMCLSLLCIMPWPLLSFITDRAIWSLRYPSDKYHTAYSWNRLHLFYSQNEDTQHAKKN